MIQELIIGVIKAGIAVIQTTREAVAKDLREIADDLENGGVVPDEAFERAKTTRDATADAYNKLPKG